MEGCLYGTPDWSRAGASPPPDGVCAFELLLRIPELFDCPDCPDSARILEYVLLDTALELEERLEWL